jgi:hypothetical protein
MVKRASVDTVGAALAAALGILGGCGGIDGQARSDGGPSGPGNPGDDAQGSDASVQAFPDAAHAYTDATGAVPTTCTLPSCTIAAPVVIGGVDTGYDTCQGGAMRRRAEVDCPSLLPRAFACPVPDGGLGGNCRTDSDCTLAANGFCRYFPQGGASLQPGCQCEYGCVRDSDCPSSTEICVCGDPMGICVSGSCSGTQSCQASCDCIAPAGTSFQCQTPEDTCSSNADCAGMPQPTGHPPGSPGGCGYTGMPVCTNYDSMGNPTGRLTCQPGVMCVTGRPFLVNGCQRCAPAIARDEWACGTVIPEASGLPTEEREVAAAHWTRVGQMEHASIAAFARFTLHLLALGAPPELLQASQQALGDETKHARLAFALASAFGGVRVGPGPLAIDGALDGFDVRTFVATLIREGCIGETVAAMEAREALEDVRDSAVRAVLETIARDEVRHAALAWRTLRWVIASGRVGRASVRDEMKRAMQEGAAPAACDTAAGALRAVGDIGPVCRHELRRAAISSVIADCAAALLSDPSLLVTRAPVQAMTFA